MLMSKKRSKWAGYKNLKTRKEEAKTFHAVLAVVVDEYTAIVRNNKSLLKCRERLAGTDRARHEKSIREYELQLRLLEDRRQRYELCQANRKLPVALMKQIAVLETAILTAEPGYKACDRTFIRDSKRELVALYEQVERITNPPKPMATTNRAFRLGGTYSGQSITRTYDGHVWEVLKTHFQPLPRAKGQRASFRIVVDLPEKNEYLQLKERRYEQSLDALVDDAYGIVDELQAELQQAYDNMPGGLQRSAVGEARAEAALRLESISDHRSDTPTCLSSIRIVHYPSLHKRSRGDRAAEAAAVMRALAKAVQDHLAAR
jgi:hypothetical protein